MQLHKFEDFILERFMMSLNESVIRFSDNFQEILAMIDSPIARELLQVYDQDREVKTNWFDIGKDQEHLSFLIDAKAQKMDNPYVRVTINSPTIGSYYRDFLKEIGFDNDKFYIPQTGEVGKILKTRKRQNDEYYLLSFSEDDSKQCVIRKVYTAPDMTIYWTKNRQEIRVGRGVRALIQSLNLEFSDAQIEEFVNKYKAAYEIAKDAFRMFELVRGNKIAELYHQANYLEPDLGDLGNSCMKRKPSWYFGIYTQNSSVCSLLVLKSVIDDTKIVGRALVWNLTEPDIMFMDRVYANKPAQVELFRRYAQSQGWHYKKQNDNSASAITISPEGTEVNFERLKVRIKAIGYTGYPYVDTLKYLSEQTKKTGVGVDNFLSTQEGGILLQDTEGNWVSDECECCGGSERQGCAECDATGTCQCTECKGKGENDCSDCEGSGKEQCGECEGRGEIDGEDCGGCGGEAELDCSTCNGNCTLPCDECGGNGEYTCGYCDGDGQVDCTCCSP